METRESKKESRSNTRKIILAVILIALGILVLFGLFRFGSILTILLVYPWVFSKVSGISTDPYLAQMIAVPAAIAIGLTLWQLVFSKHKARRIAGVFVLGLIIVLHSFAMIVISQGKHPVTEELAAFRGSLSGFWIIPVVVLVALALFIYRVISLEWTGDLISTEKYIGMMSVLAALFLVLASLFYGLIESSLGMLFVVGIELIVYCGLGLLFYGKYVKEES